MTKKTITLSILDLAGVKSSMETLMLSKELGVENSLILHSNVKECKPHLEAYDDEVKVIQHQCYKTSEDDQLVYDDEGKMIMLPGKMTEFRSAMKRLNERKVIVDFQVLKISKLPEKLGQIQGNDFYQFVPALFDHVYVTDEEYTALGN